jgi:hypothetical protein
MTSEALRRVLRTQANSVHYLFGGGAIWPDGDGIGREDFRDINLDSGTRI